jgi:hypothetical protein
MKRPNFFSFFFSACRCATGGQDTWDTVLRVLPRLPSILCGYVLEKASVYCTSLSLTSAELHALDKIMECLAVVSGFTAGTAGMSMCCEPSLMPWTLIRDVVLFCGSVIPNRLLPTIPNCGTACVDNGLVVVLQRLLRSCALVTRHAVCGFMACANGPMALHMIAAGGVLTAWSAILHDTRDMRNAVMVTLLEGLCKLWSSASACGQLAALCKLPDTVAAVASLDDLVTASTAASSQREVALSLSVLNVLVIQCQACCRFRDAAALELFGSLKCWSWLVHLVHDWAGRRCRGAPDAPAREEDFPGLADVADADVADADVADDDVADMTCAGNLDSAITLLEVAVSVDWLQKVLVANGLVPVLEAVLLWKHLPPKLHSLGISCLAMALSSNCTVSPVEVAHAEVLLSTMSQWLRWLSVLVFADDHDLSGAHAEFARAISVVQHVGVLLPMVSRPLTQVGSSVVTTFLGLLLDLVVRNEVMPFGVRGQLLVVLSLWCRNGAILAVAHPVFPLRAAFADGLRQALRDRCNDVLWALMEVVCRLDEEPASEPPSELASSQDHVQVDCASVPDVRWSPITVVRASRCGSPSARGDSCSPTDSLCGKFERGVTLVPSVALSRRELPTSTTLSRGTRAALMLCASLDSLEGSLHSLQSSLDSMEKTSLQLKLRKELRIVFSAMLSRLLCFGNLDAMDKSLVKDLSAAVGHAEDRSVAFGSVVMFKAIPVPVVVPVVPVVPVPVPVPVSVSVSVSVSGHADCAVKASCVICTELFEPYEYFSSKCGRVLYCGHMYHSSCLGTWLQTSNSCPLCRQPVYK